MNPVGMALDGKLIVSMCPLIKAMWEDCFRIIICCSQYEALTICHAYGIQMHLNDASNYRYAMPTAF
jgi:hypothetical protein